jgi:Nitronate monooxygenase
LRTRLCELLGSEAGGFGGTVGALALVPQVADAVSPIPVVAAGGIADGRRPYGERPASCGKPGPSPTTRLHCKISW